MIKNVTLPDYTKKEEILNAVSHGLGVPLGIFCMAFCLLKSASPNQIWGSVVFSVSMIILYASSTAYHSLKKCDAKKVMRLIDHSVIFLLITGTGVSINFICAYPYVPIFADIMIFISISFSLLGVILTIIDHEKYKKIQMILYFFVGSIFLALIYPIIKYCTEPGKIIGLILAGGLVYSIGTVFYVVGKKKRYMHSVFHIFVLGGSVLHFLAIYYAI